MLMFLGCLECFFGGVNMTNKYNDVFLNAVSTVVGPYELKGPFSNLFDKGYDNLYCGKETWEEAESLLIKESVLFLIKKLNKKFSDIDLFISGDLLNQCVASNYAALSFNIPYLGIYSACASSVEGLILGSNMIEAGQVNNCLCSTSSHNNGAEKQFRYPVEYGGSRPNYATFTTTGGVAAYLSKEKKGIKVESSTIGVVRDYGIKDVFHMGAVMAPGAANTIFRHLQDMDRDVNYYDLILTGDLGIHGKNILKTLMMEEYNIDLNNHDDAACMIFDITKQNVYAGGSGPACGPLVLYSYVFNKMAEKKLSKVLFVATGALMNQGMINYKKSIPCIAHAISLEVI